MIWGIWFLLTAVGWADDPTEGDGEASDASASQTTQITDARIQGVVLERGSGAPVAATVHAGGRSVQTSEDGSFVIDVVSGDVEVRITADDHRDATFTETIDAGGRLALKYRMERFSWDGEVVVYGDTAREEVSRKVISAAELRLVPGTFGDPIRALQSLPGVARAGPGGGDIIVRGAEASNTGTYVDGMPVPVLFHWFIGRSIVNPALLEEIEFYPGGMPSRFGDVTQAVVNARTKIEAPKRGIHGRLRLDVLDAQAGFHGKIKDWSFAAGGTWSWLPGVITVVSAVTSPDNNPSRRPARINLHYADYNLRLTRRMGDHRVSMAAFGSRDILSIRPERFDEDGDGVWDDPSPDVDVDKLPYDPNELMKVFYHRGQIRWDFERDKHKSQTWLMVGMQEQSNVLFDTGGFAAGPELGLMRMQTVRGWRQDRLELSDSVVLNGGALLQIQPMYSESWRDLGEDLKPVNARDLQLTVGPWIEPQIKAGGFWVAPGIRLNVHRFNADTYVEPEPRVSVRQRLADHWTGTAFVGRFTQIPPGYQYAKDIGNSQLPLMRSYQASTGVEGRWASGLEVDVSVYGSYMPNLSVQDVQVVVERAPNSEVLGTGGTAQVNRRQVYNDVTGYAFGAEAMARWRPNNGWFGWVALTVSKALRVDQDGAFNGDYDQPFAVVGVMSRELPKGWNVSARYQGTSGQPYTPQHGVWDQRWGQWVPLEGETNAERLPMFHQLDLRIDKTWTGRRARWTFYVDVMNATNQRNFYFPSYNFNYSRLERQFSMPIIPNPGLEVAF